MQYDRLIKDAWAMTWRYRFLWILALLAGGAIGVPGLNGAGGGDNGGSAPGSQAGLQQLNPAIEATAQQVSAWATSNIGLLVAAVVIVAVFAFALLVLSFIAQGGMAQATSDIATGHTSSFGSAWAAGVHLFWRYVGLWLVLVVAAIGIGVGIAILAAVAALLMTIGQAPAIGVAVVAVAAAALIFGFVAFVLNVTRRLSAAPRWLIGLAAFVFALPIFTVLIAVALGVSIVVAFAQRAIAVENTGPLDALRTGWRLLRTHLSESLIAWLVNLGLALATAIGIGAGFVGMLVLLVGVGAVVFAVSGLSAATVAYAAVGGLALLLGVLTLAGIANTFFWSYWTLAYLRLSGRSSTSPA